MSIETYGDPHLKSGVYPILDAHNMGGCGYPQVDKCGSLLEHSVDLPHPQKELIEHYGTPRLHHTCYPGDQLHRADHACSRNSILDDPRTGVPSMTDMGSEEGTEGLVEHYGSPKLNIGYFPEDAAHQLGGCMGAGPALPASSLEKARITERKLRMEQRAGNNPFEFEEIPLYAKQGYVTGVGCMSPGCHCKDCHYDCLCDETGCMKDKGLHDGYGPGMLSGVLPSPPKVGKNFGRLLLLALIVWFVYKNFN